MNDTVDPAGRPVTLPDGVDGDALREEHTAVMTACGPLCDRKHLVDQPHNRNRAPIQPQDYQPKGNPQRDEAEDREVTFQWDGEDWTFSAADATSLEFLAALDDAESNDDPTGLIRAMRLLLGREQAARLFKGRQVPAIQEFFAAAGEAGGMGNR